MDDIMLTNSINTTNDSQLLVIGSERGGKTHYFIKPNLLKITDSVVVIGRKNDKLDNCKNKVILRVNDPDDAKYISNLSNGVFSPEEILQNMNCAFFIKDKKFQKKIINK